MLARERTGPEGYELCDGHFKSYSLLIFYMYRYNIGTGCQYLT